MRCSKERIINLLFRKDGQVSSWPSRRHWWEERGLGYLYDFLIQETSHLPNDVRWGERAYNFYQGMKDRPKCLECQKNSTKFKSFESGYSDFCSIDCSNSSKIRSEKISNGFKRKFKGEHAEAIKEGYRKKYGVDHFMKVEGYPDKIRESVQKKYGVDNVFQTDFVKEKSKITMLSKYGVENYFQRIDLISQDWYENYGVYNVQQLPEIRNKRIETLKSKYGELQGVVPKEKYTQTMNEKYGVDHFFSSKEGKMSVKNLKQRYGWKDGEINDLLERKTPNGIRRGFSSKESSRFFLSIYRSLKKLYGINRNQVWLGIDGSKEYTIYSPSLGKKFFYDFTVLNENSKFIIEYNGVKFHPKSPEDENWQNPFRKESLSAREQYNRDEEKRKVALENGFKYLVIWSDDPDKTERTLDFVKGVLNE